MNLFYINPRPFAVPCYYYLGELVAVGERERVVLDLSVAKRYPHAMDACRQRPPEFKTDTAYVRCWLYEDDKP